MSYLAIFKRIIPFFLTFAAGLLIASIFVPITSPSFRGVERGRKWRGCYESKAEAEYLRSENVRLRNENEELRRESQDWDTTNLKYIVPEVNVDAPPPPPPPTRPHRPHGNR